MKFFTSRAVKPFIVPILVIGYLVMFWRSVSSLALEGAGMPRLLIAGILILSLIALVRDVRTSKTEVLAAQIEDDDERADNSYLAEGNPSDGAHASRQEILESGETGDERRLSWRLRRRVSPMIFVGTFLVFYWFLLPNLGAYPSTALFVGGLAFALGYRNVLGILASVSLALVVVAVFTSIFTLPLAGFGGSG